jgi:hypothetical protein
MAVHAFSVEEERFGFRDNLRDPFVRGCGIKAASEITAIDVGLLCEKLAIRFLDVLVDRDRILRVRRGERIRAKHSTHIEAELTFMTRAAVLLKRELYEITLRCVQVGLVAAFTLHWKIYVRGCSALQRMHMQLVIELERPCIGTGGGGEFRVLTGTEGSYPDSGNLDIAASRQQVRMTAGAVSVLHLSENYITAMFNVAFSAARFTDQGPPIE